MEYLFHIENKDTKFQQFGFYLTKVINMSKHFIIHSFLVLNSLGSKIL